MWLLENLCKRGGHPHLYRLLLDSIDFAQVSKYPSYGRSSVLFRSLSRKPATVRPSALHVKTSRTSEDTCSAIARGKFSNSYFDAAFPSGRMFNETDVDGSPSEQATGEYGNEFSNLAHRLYARESTKPCLAEGTNFSRGT
jgi:hypothetical protein